MKVTLSFIISTLLILAEIPNPSLLALPDGQWSQIPKSSIVDDVGDMQIEGCHDSYCDLNGIFDYSGGVFDQSHHRFIIYGGGHYGYYGNQIYTFELDNLTWKLWYQPSPISAFITPPTYKFSDGKPVSRHTYDQMDYIDHLDLFFQYSGATAEWYGYHNGASFGDLWTFDFKSVTWKDHTSEVTGGENDYYLSQPGFSGEYDPKTKKFYYFPHGVWSYDFTAKHWTKLLDKSIPGIERSSVLDTKRRKIFTYGGDYGGEATFSEYDIDKNTLSTISTSSEPGPRSGAGIAYDEANDLIVLFGGKDSQKSVWYYDYDTKKWSQTTYSNGPQTNTRNYNRFAYDRTHNLFFYIHRNKNESVWVWKNTMGSAIVNPQINNNYSQQVVAHFKKISNSIWLSYKGNTRDNKCVITLFNGAGKRLDRFITKVSQLQKGVSIPIKQSAQGIIFVQIHFSNITAFDKVFIY